MPTNLRAASKTKTKSDENVQKKIICYKANANDSLHSIAREHIFIVCCVGKVYAQTSLGLEVRDLELLEVES